jgi:hypothetical protein
MQNGAAADAFAAAPFCIHPRDNVEPIRIELAELF